MGNTPNLDRYHQITVGIRPTEMINTQYGVINGRDWLNREKIRLQIGGLNAEVRPMNHGNLALFAVLKD